MAADLVGCSRSCLENITRLLEESLETPCGNQQELKPPHFLFSSNYKGCVSKFK